MKIAFATGSLEPGRDGVGDYVRTLAAECVRLGHEVRLLALAEPAAPSAATEAATVRRQTLAETRADEGRAARRWLDEFAPDWVSLHFVPYGFHPGGFFGPVVPALAHVLGAGRRRQVFFHEIWIDLDPDAPLRTKLTGWWQRRAVRRLLSMAAPDAVHTSSACYRAALAALGTDAAILPVFGNVPLASAGTAAATLPGIPTDGLLCGHFGSLHPGGLPDEFLGEFMRFATAQGRPPVLVAVGALRAGAADFDSAAARWRGRMHCVRLGELPVQELAAVFARFDFGVTSVPWHLLGKSGSAAALREHGLRVVVTRAAPPRLAAAAVTDDPGFHLWRPAQPLPPEILIRLPRPAGAEMCARAWLGDLSAAASPVHD